MGQQEQPGKGPEDLNLRTPSNIMTTFGKGRAKPSSSLEDMPPLIGSDFPYSDSSDDATQSLEDELQEGGDDVNCLQ